MGWRRIGVFVVVALAATTVWGQPRGTGLVVDPARYDAAPTKPTYTSRSYEKLPAMVSLKAYAPEGDIRWGRNQPSLKTNVSRAEAVYGLLVALEAAP